MVKNIMIVGVGGQGALLASKTLGQVLLDAGYDVKVSEVHGMSQRGGSVVTYVRYGDKVYSPIVDKGQADFIVSFELLEAAGLPAPEWHLIGSLQQNKVKYVVGKVALIQSADSEKLISASVVIWNSK